jgi:hypothetical protein
MVCSPLDKLASFLLVVTPHLEVEIQDTNLECAVSPSSINWTPVTNRTPVIAITLTNPAPAQFFRLNQF